MIRRQEVFEGLYGAWRLFIRDRSAVALFDDSISGYWKSFFAAVVVLPVYFLLAWIGPAATEPSRGLVTTVLIHAEFYVIGWVLWPLLTAHAAPAFDRDAQYPLYIVAYNWSAGVQAAFLVLAYAIGTVVSMSDGLRFMADLIVLAVLLLYHMFILRVTLNVQTGPAIAIVIFEFVLSQIVLGVRNSVLM
jgi:hypothetical protein